MVSYKHFRDLYQEKVMFDSSELVIAQILLGPVQNWTRHFQRWTTRKCVHAWALLSMDPAEKESSYCLQYGRSEGVLNKICTFNLGSTTKILGTSLNDESFRTFLAEVKAIVNKRPITSKSISDVHIPVPLCPTQLLAMKSRVIMPPPGEFQKEDIYCRKQWERVQHLANEFLSRWKRKFKQSCKFLINGAKLWETLRFEILFCYGRRQVLTSSQWVE